MASDDDPGGSRRERLRTPSETGVSGLQSVNRTLDVLDLLSRRATTVGDAAVALGVDKSTSSRLLAAIAARGYAARNPVSGTYGLGPKIGQLHVAYLSARRIGRDGSILLDRVAARTGETVLLTAFEDGEAVYIDKVESDQPLRTSSRIGHHGPLHAGAAGKAILASLAEAELDRILGNEALSRVGPRTITSRRQLAKELELIRERGYSVSIEEINEGVVGVGVALLRPDRYPLGAISVTGPTARFGPRRIRDVGADLLAARQEWQGGIEPGPGS